MRTVSDIIEGCDYANGGTVEIEWADWQTLKSAVLAQQTNNSAITPPDKKALDWNCPFCGEQNSTEKPDKVLQCTWCMKKVPAKLVE